jgi:outer membrane protein
MQRSQIFVIVAGAIVISAAVADAEPLRLSVEDAVRRAGPASGALAAARASAESARHQIGAAESGRLPQVNANASYSRTLRSEFDGISFGAPAEGEMMGEAAEEVDLPFGQRNVWRAGLTVSQLIWDAGRTRSGIDQARAGAAASRLELRSIEAQAVLAVAEAYYDAALAQRQVDIAAATLELAETTLAETQLNEREGAAPEFDVVRSEVARDNQRTARTQFEAQRDIAFVRLKRLLDVPLDQPLELTSALDIEDLADVDRFNAAARTAAGLGQPEERVAIQQAREALRGRQAALRGAKADRWPELSAVSDLGFVNYPEELFPVNDDWRTNWTVGVNLTVPVFDGFRRRAAVRSARAEVTAAEARLADAGEQVRADERTTDAAIAAAQAVWQTSARTSQLAQRAYQIAELRFEQGASTHLELVDARLSLEQAQLNQARAARDLRIARLRNDLLDGLPLF